MSQPANIKPPAGWYPNLTNTNLPREAVNGIQQAFSLIYSQRDTVNQMNDAMSKMFRYGTHDQRIQNTTAQTSPDGALFFETDTKTIFQVRLNPSSNVREWVQT